MNWPLEADRQQGPRQCQSSGACLHLCKNGSGTFGFQNAGLNLWLTVAPGENVAPAVGG